MILGIGIDICNLSRIEKIYLKNPEKFIKRLCNEYEQEKIQNLPENKKTKRLAHIFAAKEAGSKALGTGFKGGLGLHSFTVQHTEKGQPILTGSEEVKNIIAEKFNKQHRYSFHLSLSDEGKNIIAVVVVDLEIT